METRGSVKLFGGSFPTMGWGFLPEFRKKKENVMKHMVECQPLRVGETDYPEHREMLLPTKSSQQNTTRITLASLLLCFSISMSCVMWVTDVYDNSILKLVSIRNDIDMIFNLWRQPPTRPILSIYIFNYTNVKSALQGKEKPHVEEIGPYVFRERMERININFHKNNTVSFQENRSIEFAPELSKGSMNDTVFVPNIPVLTVLKKARSFYYVSQKLVSTVMSNLKVEPFQKISVHDFIWGYEDKFFQMIRNVSSFLQRDVPPKFGFLSKRKGVHHHVVTMYTGNPNLDVAGEITMVDGNHRIGLWGDTECDSLKGSDGTLFPGNKANSHAPLFIYSPDMCRRIPIHFNKTTKSNDGFPVLQYNVPDTLFDFSGKTSSNMCYQYNEGYPPSGVFNTGPCQNGSPSYASFPHFLFGENSLREKITGLNPKPEIHRSSFHIHERIGVCLLARTRFQLNIQLQKPTYIPFFSGIEDGTIFPVAWMDYNSGPLPQHFVNVVHHLTYTVRIVQQLLIWFSLIILLLSIYFMYKQLKVYYDW